MRQIGIYFYSRYGQTRKISEFAAERLKAAGCSAMLIDLGSHEHAYVDSSFDAVLIAAPVYAHGYPASVEKFLIENRDVLLSKDTGFCSVCLAHTPHTRESLREAMAPVRTFLERYHWSPKWLAVFPGALQYRDYSFLVRFAMKRISRSSGGPTDTSRNYEFTNWDEVARFATEVALNRSGGEFSNEAMTSAAA